MCIRDRFLHPHRHQKEAHLSFRQKLPLPQHLPLIHHLKMCIRDRAIDVDCNTIPATFAMCLLTKDTSIRAGTVSYTHLDVYKRQVSSCVIPFNGFRFSSMVLSPHMNSAFKVLICERVSAAASFTSVSYTHLNPVLQLRNKNTGLFFCNSFSCSGCYFF